MDVIFKRIKFGSSLQASAHSRCTLTVVLFVFPWLDLRSELLHSLARAVNVRQLTSLSFLANWVRGPYTILSLALPNFSLTSQSYWNYQRGCAGPLNIRWFQDYQISCHLLLQKLWFWFGSVEDEASISHTFYNNIDVVAFYPKNVNQTFKMQIREPLLHYGLVLYAG